MSGTRRDTSGLTIGGEPRIDFLPPEVKAGKQAKKTRRSLVALIVIVLVACAGGYVFATSLAAQSQAKLAQAQADTQELLKKQTQYAEARTVANQLAAAKDARLVGTANEILWQDYLAELKSTLPSGVSIQSVTVDSISAIEEDPVASVPLQGSRVATLTISAHTPNLPAIATWLNTMTELTGFADVWAGSAKEDDDGYTVDVVLNVNADALEKRFFADYESEPAADSSGTPATDAEDSTATDAEDATQDDANVGAPAGGSGDEIIEGEG